MDDGLSHRQIEPGQQPADMPDSLDDALVEKNVRLDDFRSVLLAGPYFRV